MSTTTLFNQRFPRAARIYHEGLDSGLHIGLQLFVSRAGEVLFDGAGGEARPGVAMTRDTIMLWLSSSKPITAILIGLLAEEGRVDLDQPVATYVPEFGQGGKENVTLRHVLTHSGGFRFPPRAFDEVSFDVVFQSVCEMPLEKDWVPGQRTGYHPMSGWLMLGEVIHRVTGQPCSAFARDRLFGPLGMEDAWLGMPTAQLHRYGDRFGQLQRMNPRDPQPYFYDTPAGCAVETPGGNAHGPMRALARFYQMLLNGGEGIVAPETVTAFVSRQRVGVQDETMRHKMDYGLGFILNGNRYGPQTLPYSYGLHASERIFGHGGMQSSVGFADPAHDLVVACVFNGTPGEPKHNRRVRRFMTALYEDLGLVE